MTVTAKHREGAMRWDSDHQSADLIDRRGEGGASLLPLVFLLLRSPFGWVGLAILAIGWAAWQLVGSDLQRAGVMGGQGSPGNDEQAAFVGYVLDDVQDTWQRKFAERGETYERAKLVLFTGSTPTACGYGDAATGPFYCPADQQVYIDLSFYDELRRRFGAPGDFAQAYVIGHEIGHHVQNLLGVSDKVHRAPLSNQRGAKGLSVRLELQADCYAGVWAHDADRRQLIEVGDVDEALQAAAAIGDDRLQSMSHGTVSPESFSHGTSVQRKRWFERGYRSGDPSDCDTFSGEL
jgi:predicted metalloprotease